MRLLGGSAWWLPRWLDRLLPDVRFGHGEVTDSAGGDDAAAQPGPVGEGVDGAGLEVPLRAGH
jgi:RND superfamily putative drug exporter